MEVKRLTRTNHSLNPINFQRLPLSFSLSLNPVQFQIIFSSLLSSLLSSFLLSLPLSQSLNPMNFSDFSLFFFSLLSSPLSSSVFSSLLFLSPLISRTGTSASDWQAPPQVKGFANWSPLEVGREVEVGCCWGNELFQKH